MTEKPADLDGPADDLTDEEYAAECEQVDLDPPTFTWDGWLEDR